MTQRVCIVGGGASGIAMLWCVAKAKQQGLGGWDYDVTLIHQPTAGLTGVGGHSCAYPVTVNGSEYWIDLGVQMIAPKMYPNTMCLLRLPEFAGIKLQPVELNISCAFPPVGGTTPYWGNFPGYQSTPLYQSGEADCSAFDHLMKAEPYLLAPLSAYLNANKNLFNDLDSFESDGQGSQPAAARRDGRHEPLPDLADRERTPPREPRHSPAHRQSPRSDGRHRLREQGRPRPSNTRSRHPVTSH